MISSERKGKMEKKWIIFDMMGVIFEVGDDTNDLLVPYVQNINVNCSKEKINTVYKEASLGKIESKKLWVNLGVANDINYEVIEKKYLDNCLIIDKQFIEVAKRLNGKYKLAILSNDLKEWSKYLRAKYGIDDVVECSIISGEVGYRKPSEEIYDIVLSEIDCKPEDCVFIDDREKNLVPAKEKGMKVIKFLRDEKDCKLDECNTIESFYDLETLIENLW